MKTYRVVLEMSLWECEELRVGLRSRKIARKALSFPVSTACENTELTIKKHGKRIPLRLAFPGSFPPSLVGHRIRRTPA